MVDTEKRVQIFLINVEVLVATTIELKLGLRLLVR